MECGCAVIMVHGNGSSKRMNAMMLKIAPEESGNPPVLF
jgi:hypothetical protein